MVIITNENAPRTCEIASTIAASASAPLGPRVQVHDDLGVAAGLEDRALAHERVAQLAGVDQVAVVADGELAVDAVDHDRLRVGELALAGRGIADVPDGETSRSAWPATRSSKASLT